MSKSQLVAAISDATELTKRDVKAVLESLEVQVGKSLSRKGPGVFTLPGLVKIERRKVPARKARRNVPNPFKPGEMMDVPAKPASTKIKVRALKNLKGMA
jgi:nucleoid DNA-binding protein